MAAIMRRAGIGAIAALLLSGLGSALADGSSSSAFLAPRVGREVAATTSAASGRVAITNGTFTLNGQEVVLLGGNYVVKARPYFPEVAVVRSNARSMAEAARAMQYVPSAAADGSPRRVLPCVRLGALFEGAMPDSPVMGSSGIDSGIDPTWASNLGATVEAFAAEGVYVFLDIHQDALSTTNGGEGMPWWMAARMQETSRNGESYIVSPEHPLRSAVPEGLGIPIPHVRTSPNDTDPWRAYAVGTDAGDPRKMNVGNLDMRLNNNDQAWQSGILSSSAQAQNFAYRFWHSYAVPEDKAAFFDPYLVFVLHLCRLWERSQNIVAVELFNEPPPGGLPDLRKVRTSRRDLFNFYAAVLEELDGAKPPVRAPIAIEDVLGQLPGSSQTTRLLKSFPLETRAKEKVSEWAMRSQVVFSFHFYPGPMTTLDLAGMVSLAKQEASEFGAVPVYLSEYFTGQDDTTAKLLARATELGCNAATFWHYVDKAFTGTDGWFKYPPSVLVHGKPIDGSGNVNWKAWEAYQKTVVDGTYWGAYITGSGGGRDVDLLKLVPKLP